MKDRLSGRVIHGANPGPKPYLTKEEESQLASHLLQAADIGYGKTRRDVCCIVETYLKQKGALKGERVSHGWWEKFMKRNPSLRLRVGDSTAGVRLDAVNQENMNDLLNKTYTEHDFDKHPETIYNMDETGVPLCPRPPRIVAKKGQKKKFDTGLLDRNPRLLLLDAAVPRDKLSPPSLFFLVSKLVHCGLKMK